MMSEAVTDLVAEGGRVLASDDCASDGLASALAGAGATSNASVRTGLAPDDLDDDGRRLMSAFSIHYDGRRFRYNGYRYDRLADAVAYAGLMQSRQSSRAGPDPFTPGDVVPSPGRSDRETMASLAISFTAGVYAYREFRYDHLADAVSYAHRDLDRH
jgi:hypothetical protein